jgi:hypothetical protein
LGFDHKIVGAADHEQMFDVVAPDNNELALTVEVESINNCEADRPCPAIVR